MITVVDKWGFVVEIRRDDREETSSANKKVDDGATN